MAYAGDILGSMSSILTDRSRYVTGTQQCQTRRYYQYHWGGTGIVPSGLSLNLWTGTAIHKGLEAFYRLAQLGGSQMPERALLRPAIAKALAEMESEGAEHGFLEDPNREYVLREQLSLAEGLIWAYIRTIAPSILAEYTVEAVELELGLDIEEVRLQVRPDLVLRSRANARLSIVDFKSMSSLGDAAIEEFRTSPQMASCCLAAQTHFGEPVSQYSIHALVKGSRKAFTKKGQQATNPRQYSSFCYAKYSPACPPLTEACLDLGGYWFDKQPTWTMDLPLEEGQSKIEALVEMMPLGTLYGETAIIGPYDASEFLAQQFLRSLLGEERSWQERLERAKGCSQQELDQSISRSYKCHDYGAQCPYYDLCFQTVGDWDKPLELGRFNRRTPHHAEELERFREGGLLDEV